MLRTGDIGLSIVVLGFLLLTLLGDLVERRLRDMRKNQETHVKIAGSRTSAKPPNYRFNCHDVTMLVTDVLYLLPERGGK